MATFDYRSSAGWKYKVLPIEQVFISTFYNDIKFDYILSSSNYSINPIIRGRDVNGNVMKVIGYTVDVNIDILFDELNVITTDLTTNFVGKMVSLSLYLSSINAVGTNEWRKVFLTGMSCNMSVNKEDKQPKISLLFSGTLNVNELNSTGIFLNWVSSQPA